MNVYPVLLCGEKEIKGPSSYSGPIEVIIDELHVVAVFYIDAGSYIVGDVKKEGNKISFRLYTAPGQEVASGTDLSNITIRIYYCGK